MINPLLETKLYAPSAPSSLLPRPRLVERLNGNPACRLTLVSAPPGYGKTTLLLDWLRASARPFAWLSLDAADNDPARFFTYVIAALQKVDANLGQAAQSLLVLPQLPPVEAWVTLLINDVAAAGRDVALVLDDYHTVRTPAIHEGVEFLVQHAPPQLQLVLITREDPPFSLSRLRALGQVNEIRADDLRFTAEEAACFLRECMGLSLDADMVRTLDARTEGWIAGLQLAALSLQGHDVESMGDFIQAFGGTNRYVIDYLLDEVLRRQPDEVRNFLCRTAILDRFNAALGDALTGRSDGKAMLTYLEQANLFLVPLDSRREWFRYHPLFADLLRTELGAPEQAALHRTAAHWHEANGYVAEAIKHALAADDVADAARLIRQAAGKAFQKGELATLLDWIKALPDDTVRDDIDLATYKAAALFFKGQTDAAAACLAEIDNRIRKSPRISRGRLLALQAWQADLCGDAQTTAIARQALGLIGDADPVFRILALLPLGHALRDGDLPAATQVFREALDLAQRIDYPLGALAALVNLAFNLGDQGALGEAMALCEDALARCVDRHGRPLPVAGLLYAPLATLCYAVNDLEHARAYALQSIALSRQVLSDRIMGGDAERTLALADFALGRPDDALAKLRDARAMAKQTGAQRVAAMLAAAEAGLHIRRGDLAAAAQWAEAAGLSASDAVRPERMLEYWTLARFLLAQGRGRDALPVLDALERCAKANGNTLAAVRAGILRALAEQSQGSSEAALSAMERAVRLAAAAGYVRIFLDVGAGGEPLLQRVRAAAPGFVDRVLGAMASPAVQPSSPSDSPVLSVPLSERERQVLRLIAEGRSNAEIAHALVITVGTTKWHVNRILAKLGAGSRTQAIARARELGLV